MNRRKFIKKITRFGFLAGTASLFYPVSKLMAALISGKTPAFAAVKDNMPEVITGKGIVPCAVLPEDVKKNGKTAKRIDEIER